MFKKIIAGAFFLLFIIFLLVSRSYFGEIGRSKGKEHSTRLIENIKSEEDNKDTIESILLLTSRELNKNLPANEGEGVLLRTTRVEGKTISYEVVLLNLSINDIDQNEFSREKRPLIIEDLCIKESVKYLLNNGAVYSYDVYSKENTLINRFFIDINDCNNIN